MLFNQLDVFVVVDEIKRKKSYRTRTRNTRVESENPRLKKYLYRGNPKGKTQLDVFIIYIILFNILYILLNRIFQVSW